MSTDQIDPEYEAELKSAAKNLFSALDEDGVMGDWASLWKEKSLPLIERAMREFQQAQTLTIHHCEPTSVMHEDPEESELNGHLQKGVFLAQQLVRHLRTSNAAQIILPVAVRDILYRVTVSTEDNAKRLPVTMARELALAVFERNPQGGEFEIYDGTTGSKGEVIVRRIS